MNEAIKIKWNEKLTPHSLVISSGTLSPSALNRDAPAAAAAFIASRDPWK